MDVVVDNQSRPQRRERDDDRQPGDDQRPEPMGQPAGNEVSHSFAVP